MKSTIGRIWNFALVMMAILIVPVVVVSAWHLAWKAHQYFSVNLAAIEAKETSLAKPMTPTGQLAEESLVSAKEELEQAGRFEETYSVDKEALDTMKRARVTKHKTTDYISRVLLAETEARDAGGKVVETLSAKTVVRYFPLVDSKKFAGDTRNWVSVVKAPFAATETRFVPAESVTDQEVDAKTMKWKQTGKSQWEIMVVPGKPTPVLSFTPSTRNGYSVDWGGQCSMSINGSEWQVLDKELPRLSGPSRLQFLLAPEEPSGKVVVVRENNETPNAA